MSDVLDQINNIKIINANKRPAPAPPQAPKASRPLDKETLLARKLNARRDLNKTHAFDFWVAYQNDINDYSAFAGYNPAMHRQVMLRLKNSSNFYGEEPQDFSNWTIAERYYYSDFSNFLGINFKKVLGSIGHGFGWLGHEVGDAGKYVGHEAGDAAKWVGHGVEDIGLGAAHDVRNVAVDTGHFVGRTEKQAWDKLQHDRKAFNKLIDPELSKIGHAIEPYWKVIAAVGLVVLCITTFGLAAPIAIALGSALLTGLDAIKEPDPPFDMNGSGGGDLGPGGDGSGFPDQGDGSNGLTPEQMQARAAAQQAAQQAQADYLAAVARRKKIILIVTGISIAAIVVAIIIWRHKHKK